MRLLHLKIPFSCAFAHMGIAHARTDCVKQASYKSQVEGKKQTLQVKNYCLARQLTLP